MDILSYLVDFIVHLDKHMEILIDQYGIWIYAILFAIVFLETALVFTPFLPGDSLLFVAGTFAAVSLHKDFTLDWVMIVLIIAAILGNTCNYWIGRFIGKQLIKWRNGTLIKKESLEQTEEFYRRHGGKTVVISRFLPVFRSFAPFVAGIGKMPHGRFQSFNITGAVLWVVSMTLLGFFFGNVPFIRSNLSLIVVVMIAISFLPFIIFKILNRGRGKKPDELKPDGTPAAEANDKGDTDV